MDRSRTNRALACDVPTRWRSLERCVVGNAHAAPGSTNQTGGRRRQRRQDAIPATITRIGQESSLSGGAQQ
jgi:hypothetical protein